MLPLPVPPRGARDVGRAPSRRGAETAPDRAGGGWVPAAPRGRGRRLPSESRSRARVVDRRCSRRQNPEAPSSAARRTGSGREPSAQVRAAAGAAPAGNGFLGTRESRTRAKGRWSKSGASVSEHLLCARPRGEHLPPCSPLPRGPSKTHPHCLGSSAGLRAQLW